MSTRALRSAAAGMYAQQINIEVISNNIANINTTGFKKNRAEFKDLIYQEVSANPQNVDTPGIVENANTKVLVGTGVKPSSTVKEFKQGDLQQTGQKLDMAIYGEGFFQVRKADGLLAYTRDGSFKLSKDGSIVTSNGQILEPGFNITDDFTDIMISRDGVVTGKTYSGDTVELGTIELAKFINPAGLKPIGDNLYVETEVSGAPILGNAGTEGFGEINQGFLESSNVDIVEEMINMITAQRSYEINSKTVKTVEEMLTIANNLKRA
jgi:flagellar basal-body rod protein FlgG